MSSAAVKLFCGLGKRISGWAVLDAEGGHVTIQGPFSDPSPARTHAPSACGLSPPGTGYTPGSRSSRAAGLGHLTAAEHDLAARQARGWAAPGLVAAKVPACYDISYWQATGEIT